MCDLDATIEAYKNNGSMVKWITVVRGSDGARVSDDIKRREVQESFTLFDDKEGVFVLASKGGLFQKSELPNPVRGEPIHWETVEKGTMTIYSMAISNNGGSELQVYRRTLTKKGMDISCLRMRDKTIEAKNGRQVGPHQITRDYLPGVSSFNLARHASRSAANPPAIHHSSTSFK